MSLINSKDWTEPEMALLREKWGTIRAKAIGDMLGRTKNSVISRAHRLGLPCYGRKLQTLEHSVRKRVATQAKLKKNNSFFEVKNPKIKDVAPIEGPGVPDMGRKKEIEPINGVGVKFINLERHHCRWVTDDDVHFCGHNVKEGQSYCQDHYSVVYRPVIRKR